MEKPFVIFHLLFGPAFSIQAFGHWWVTQQLAPSGGPESGAN